MIAKKKKIANEKIRSAKAKKTEEIKQRQDRMMATLEEMKNRDKK